MRSSTKVQFNSFDDRFSEIAAGNVLPAAVVNELHEAGFVVIPGPWSPVELQRAADAYDRAALGSIPGEVRVGSSTTRINDFVNRGPEFDGLYIFAPILEACRRVIGEPFRLSTLHGRTVRPHVEAQELHVDFARDDQGWPMVGFILMVDEFRADNGATGFIPGSHRWTETPAGSGSPNAVNNHGRILACGPAGSIIVYNGSVWHGYAANSSAAPRRSLQGAFIRRSETPAMDWSSRVLPATAARIDPLAKYLLGL